MIYPYIQHAHGAKWQDRQFRESIAQLPLGLVLSVVDFEENYTFAPQQEIQLEHYFLEQVFLLAMQSNYFYSNSCHAIQMFLSYLVKCLAIKFIVLLGCYYGSHQLSARPIRGGGWCS